jgi:hypothetical protein
MTNAHRCCWCTPLDGSIQCERKWLLERKWVLKCYWKTENLTGIQGVVEMNLELVLVVDISRIFNFKCKIL